LRFYPEHGCGGVQTLEVRTARGRHFEEIDGTPGQPDPAMWIRVPKNLSISTAVLAIVGDYIPGQCPSHSDGVPWLEASRTHCVWCS